MQDLLARSQRDLVSKVYPLLREGKGCSVTAKTIFKEVTGFDATPIRSDEAPVHSGGITYVDLRKRSGGEGHRFVVLHVDNMHRVLQSNAYFGNDFDLMQFCEDDVGFHLPPPMTSWLDDSVFTWWWHAVVAASDLCIAEQEVAMETLFGFKFAWNAGVHVAHGEGMN